MLFPFAAVSLAPGGSIGLVVVGDDPRDLFTVRHYPGRNWEEAGKGVLEWRLVGVFGLALAE